MGETVGGDKCPCLRSLLDRCYGKRHASEVQPDETENGEALRQPPSTPRLLPPPVPASKGETPDGYMYTALWPFHARAEEELSFEMGDRFKILSRTGEWWNAAKVTPNGQIVGKGFVPYNYLARGETAEAQPWYFGKMNRLEAVNLLLSPENGRGTFLVRLSEREHVDYVLSVKSDNKVKHFKILQNAEGLYCLNERNSFTTLMGLIDYYKTHSFSIIEKLTEGCRRKEPKPQDLSHSTVDEWELPKEEFTLGKLLGTGYFADVYEGLWKNQVRVAIKVLKNKENVNYREFQLETQILKKLRHKHLISLLAICTTEDSYYIVTELMEKGNLLNFLRGTEGRRLDMSSLLDMACQVADGMAHLESQKSIHRDLAARNVLVGDNLICKVADFGLARVTKEPFYISEDKKIPYKWCAPEAISHGRFSTKSDIWSFGVLLYEILTYGGVPYPVYNNNEVYKLITSGYRMPCPENCPKSVYNVMLSCWRDSPEDRPPFSFLRQQLEKFNKYDMD
ncbi:protein-tyrosine kinase 6 [Lepisosteus oculatus]|uniref:protein-tyrosine kinase 6 n=1 Tax=Lepisosteus oculatus TaxID=7918 RepID=UPI0035F5086E